MKTVRFKADSSSTSSYVCLSGVSDRNLKHGDRVEVEYTDGCIVELVCSTPESPHTCFGCVFYSHGCKVTIDVYCRPCIIVSDPANTVFVYKGDILEEL